MSTNPWTAEALANDYHLGDATQAAMIAAENGDDPAINCGACRARAGHYKNTIGTHKCTRCGAILLTWKQDDDGRWYQVWSDEQNQHHDYDPSMGTVDERETGWTGR